jgi:hypothetical protein
MDRVIWYRASVFLNSAGMVTANYPRRPLVLVPSVSDREEKRVIPTSHAVLLSPQTTSITYFGLLRLTVTDRNKGLSIYASLMQCNTVQEPHE